MWILTMLFGSADVAAQQYADETGANPSVLQMSCLLHCIIPQESLFDSHSYWINMTTCIAAHATYLPQCSISNAQFTLDGKTHTLQANDGSSCIHGCGEPWAKAAWRGAASADGLSATYEYTSLDGEAG
jgi:hypothetical protein